MKSKDYEFEVNPEKACHIDSFFENNDIYSLWLFTKDGDHAVLYKDDELIPIFIVSSGGRFIYNGEYVGSYRQTDKNTIEYQLFDDEYIDTGISVERAEAYLEADLVVAKKLVQQLNEHICT